MRAVLSIAGFDPSAGAGVLADIKTFESCGVYGVAACSALTVQNDTHFKKVTWVPLEEIKEQLLLLFDRFQIRHLKIGLVRDLSTLAALVHFVRATLSESTIIWDPVVRASAGFVFHDDLALTDHREILSELSVITPNLHELAALMPEHSLEDGACELSRQLPVVVKGGHAESAERSDDLLYRHGERVPVVFPGRRMCGVAKHGSGCVFSAAMCAHLEKGASLVDAVGAAKQYTATFLNSSDTLLGWHRSISERRE